MSQGQTQIQDPVDQFRRFLGQTLDAALSSRRFSPSDISYYESLGRKNRTPTSQVYSRTIIPSEQLRAKAAASELSFILSGTSANFITQLKNWVKEGRS